ncbi:MAG: disulfide bond formation protein B [Candidatus Thiothrix putei]|uniref:Disulfide bond formation protein B n=1 Tax=Candidatus Thiothrix putei TaxID=3080811 RepID=A0AA95KJX8_9GAMM|nr:MAG: disulfide bond formation protein B [Candidatus Thiothrix putei]
MNKRPHYLFVFVFCLALLGAALFFQFVMGLDPCPLCILQRMAMIGIGLVALLAFLHNPTGLVDKVYGGLLVLVGLFSVGVALRQVWLLSLPSEEAASCGPGLELWLDRFIAALPQGQVTEALLRSSAGCDEVSWSIWGLGMPQLTFPVFIFFAFYLIWLFFKRSNRHVGTFSMR